MPSSETRHFGRRSWSTRRDGEGFRLSLEELPGTSYGWLCSGGKEFGFYAV